jgi:fructoselysine-6-P-deglycase FrlB-like protein
MMKIKQIIEHMLATRQHEGRIKNLYMVACGGSLGGFYPAFYLMKRKSKMLCTSLITSNEFVHAQPDALGKNSVVLVCSMRGTPETVEAAKVARQQGAYVIAFYVEESALLDYADQKIKYQSIMFDDTRIEQTNASLQLQFCFELLYQLEECELYEDAKAAFEIVDDIYRGAFNYSIPRAQKFAHECKDESVIYVMGGGPSMGAAYVFSICNLMEMQWIHSPTVNTGELLHGPFESVDRNLPIVILVSEGPTRQVDERALLFLKKYGEKLYILDAKEFGINRINKSVVEFFNHIIFSSILNNVYLKELSYSRKHNYMNRRYMWQVEY